jgi:hypothetical protein
MTSQQRAMISPISTPARAPAVRSPSGEGSPGCLPDGRAGVGSAGPAAATPPHPPATLPRRPPPPPPRTSPRLTTSNRGPYAPLALSADRKRLFVANTAAGTLDILTVDDDGLRAEASVPVGVDPVAVAERHAGEVWVVNHLSDSISVVDVASSPPRVRQTLLVGDEPRDIVFAGPQRQRAFITTRTSRPAAQLSRPGRCAWCGRPATHHARRGPCRRLGVRHRSPGRHPGRAAGGDRRAARGHAPAPWQPASMEAPCTQRCITRATAPQPSPRTCRARASTTTLPVP